MALDQYDPSTALSAYYPSRSETRPARIWAVERAAQDLAELGLVSAFEGAGDDPTGLTGYASSKLWIRSDAGVTEAPGTVRAYDGVGDASLLASWPVLDASGLRRHLSLYSIAEVDALITAGSAGDLDYQGDWNASTNTPALADGVGTTGHVYRVSVSGSTTLDGEDAWTVGDELYFNGTVWSRLGGDGGVAASSDFAFDNRIVRSDGTGKFVQRSGISVDDSNNVTGANSIELPNDGLRVADSDNSHHLTIIPSADLTADRNLEINTGNANRVLNISSGNVNFASFGISLASTGTQSAAQSALDLTPGTDVQAQNASLQDIADLGSVADKFLYTNGVGNYAHGGISSLMVALLNDPTTTVAQQTLEVEVGVDVLAFNSSVQEIADLGAVADKILYTDGSGNYVHAGISAFAITLLNDPTAAVARTTLGVGIGSDVQAHGDVLDDLNTLGAPTADGQFVVASGAGAFTYESDGTARASLGLAIGTDVQAYDALLQDISDTTFAQGDILYYDGANIVNLGPGTAGQFLKTQGASANPIWDTIAGGGDMLASNNLSDVANAATAFSNIKQNASTTATGVVEIATNTEYRANTTGKALSTDAVWNAMAEVTLTDAASIAWNMNNGFDFSVTLGGNRTLANPTNTQVGKRGTIRVIQDGTGSRTLTFGSNYKFAGGTAPTLTTTASAEDELHYRVVSSTDIRIYAALDMS